jgi:ribonuclease P protein component
VQRQFRLTRSADFKRVRRLGKSFAHPLVVLVACEGPALRIGVAAGRTVGNAVRRNRAKRLLREASRMLLHNMRPGWDLLLIARQPLPDAGLLKTSQALEGLFTQAHLMTDLHES